MRMHREDRRELAQLGLWVLAVGVVFAPVFHAVVEHDLRGSHHDLQHLLGHGHSHEDSSSDEGPTHTHGDHDVVHLGAVALAEAPVLSVPQHASIDVEHWIAPADVRPLPRRAGAVMPQGP